MVREEGVSGRREGYFRVLAPAARVNLDVLEPIFAELSWTGKNHMKRRHGGWRVMKYAQLPALGSAKLHYSHRLSLD